jgi:hypothetical protein
VTHSPHILPHMLACSSHFFIDLEVSKNKVDVEQNNVNHLSAAPPAPSSPDPADLLLYSNVVQ